MKMRFLTSFLSVCLLFQQLPLYAFSGDYTPRSHSAAGVSEPAKTDYLGRQNVRRQEFAKASLPLYKAAGLQQEMEKALKKGDAATFYVTLIQLNELLFSQLSEPFLPVRLQALELLASHVKEGFVTDEEKKELAFRLEKLLRSTKKCQGDFCRFVGVAALTLALTAQTPQPEAIAISSELALPSQRQRILALYAHLLAHDYGSDEANQTVSEYVLRANAWLGGLEIAQAQIDQLVSQSGAGGYTYDAKNYKLQRFAVELLSAFGTESIVPLKKLAQQSPSLTVRTHAAIELAYKKLPFQEMQQVRQQLEYIYCDIKLRLPHQLDFELRQQIGYAYGEGRKPQYITDGQPRCLVVVPTAPNPHLILDEWVLKAGKEAVLWFAPVGIMKAAGTAWKTLAHLKTLRAYVNTHHGMSLRQFYESGRRLPIMGLKSDLVSSLSTVQKAQRTTSLTEPVLAQASPARKVSKVDPEIQKIRNMFLTETREMVSSTRARSNLTPIQEAHVERLATRVEENASSSYALGQVKRELMALPSQQNNAFVVFGSRMEKIGSDVLDETSHSFMTDYVGWRYRGSKNILGTTRAHLKYKLQQYGPTSDELLLRWDTHGGVDNFYRWQGELNSNSLISMPEIIRIVLDNLRGVSHKSITIFLDSCYPGAAFKDFMSLPLEMRKNFNLFALGGHMQLNFVRYLPRWMRSYLHTPLDYATYIWKYGDNINTLTGQAYVRGQIINPLGQAIKNTRYLRPTMSRELQRLQQVALADNPYSLYQAINRFVDEVPGVALKNMQWPMPYYVIPYNQTAPLKEINQLLIPNRLLEEIQGEISKISF